MQFWKIKILSYLSGIYLYRWYALAVAWAFCLIGWATIAAMPDQYKAEAKVYIDADNLMDPLLKGLTVSLDSTQEIAVMLKTLITRPTLEQVIHLTNPNANSFSPSQLELEVAKLQKNISISLLETKNYYAISYVDSNSATAASVAQTLLSILQNNRVGSTRLDMDDARSFINKKVAEYENRLRDADKRRADFKTANLEILGKGNAGNRIDVADAGFEQATKDLNAAVARRDSVKDQLATTPKTVPVDERMFLGSAVSGAMIGEAGIGARSAASNPLQRLQQAQASLDELRSRYTEDHPDVIAMKKLIAQLQSQLAAAPEAGGQPIMIPNPVYVQLEAKFSEEQTNVALQREHLGAATTELEQAKKEASNAIDTLAKYNGLDRDYGNIEATYKQLLQSREAANLSQARDDQNEGITFRVLEPPQKPQFPTAPNRPLMNSIVLLIGIAGGAAAAILLTLNAGRLITSDDVVAQFAIPLLGVVTELPQIAGRVRNRLATLALSTSVILLLLGYAGVLAVLQTSIYSLNYGGVATLLKTSIHSLIGAGYG